MGAGLIAEQCRFCKGSGKAERLEERGEYGWYMNTMLPHELADAWIKAEGDRAPLRWVDCDCPYCHGAGFYEVEYVRAKIF